MFYVTSYKLAVALCVLSMLCWGSWGNTQKLVGGRWRYELFYWDYVVGLLLLALVMGLSFGSWGDATGWSFFSNMRESFGIVWIWPFLAGVLFNAANLLFSAAIAVAGMAVAFPIGSGLAGCGGKMTAYTAVFVFSAAVFLSNFIWDAIAMRHPVAGEPIPASAYFKGGFPVHLAGIAGGAIWGLGTLVSFVSSGAASPAIAYALGQGATLVSACWGIFVWKEFADAPRQAIGLNVLMFVLFLAGLAVLVVAGA
ncbi:MAG: multidrug DMT transporter permease [bacterium]|nr:multidrug DMT transporter permease [Candidatus Colisoma equi]